MTYIGLKKYLKSPQLKLLWEKKKHKMNIYIQIEDKSGSQSISPNAIQQELSSANKLWSPAL